MELILIMTLYTTIILEEGVQIINYPTKEKKIPKDPNMNYIDTFILLFHFLRLNMFLE